MKKLKIVVIIIALLLLAGGVLAYKTFLNTPIEEKIDFSETPEQSQETDNISPTTNTEMTNSGTIQEIVSKKNFVSFVAKFRETAVDFTHVYKKTSLPAAGGSLVDIDGDGVDEVFVGGGQGQQDALLSYKNGTFTNIIQRSGITQTSTTYGSFVSDVDSDGDADIFIARNDGLYLAKNGGAGVFESKKLAVTFEKESVPLSIAGGDINNDGILDLYISTFIDASKLRTAIFHDTVHAKANILLLGKGNDVYEDITEKSGATFDQNTFISSLTDLNNDGWQDIVIAPNTEKVTIYKNNGDLTFTRLAPLSEYGFWMGLAQGDIDNDGDTDLFFSNIGNTIPLNLSRGDLRANEVLDPEWRLYENKGNFVFEDVTKREKLLNYEFAWGTILEDFNLDNRLDLSVVENFVKWPAHNISRLDGRFFTYVAGKGFLPSTAESGVKNPYYGMTPLSSDFDQNGYPDIVFVNLGGPLKVFLNEGGKNSSFAVDMCLYAKCLDATVELSMNDGQKLSKRYIPASGLYSSQSNTILFPLAPGHSITSVRVQLGNKEEKVFPVSEGEKSLKVNF